MNTKYLSMITVSFMLLFANLAYGQSPGQQNAEENKSLRTHQVADPLARYTITKNNEKKFDDWPHGKAEIVLVTQSYKPGNKQEFSVGEISEDGSFTMEDYLPTVNPDRALQHFYHCDDENNNPSHTNPNMPAVPGFFSVRQNGEDIGTLSLATAKQIAYNHSPRGKYRGDKGYRIDLLFVKGQASVKNNCTRKITATDHAEITKQISISDIYDLQFKSGWNMIKVEVMDNQSVGDIPYYKTKLYTTIHKLPHDVKWVFYKYQIHHKKTKK